MVSGCTKTLELRSQNHVHEDDRQEKGPEKLHEGLFQFAATPGYPAGVGGRHVEFSGGRAQDLEAVGQGVARRHGSPQTDRALAIDTVDTRGALGADDIHNIIETHQAAALARHVEAGDGFRILAIGGTQAELHIIVFVHGWVTVARHPIVATHHQAQGPGNVIGVHTHICSPRAVNLHPQFGLVEPQGGIGVDNTEFRSPQAQFFRIGGQGFEIRPAYHKVDLKRTAADVEGWEIAHQRTQFTVLFEAAARFLDQVILSVIATERGPRVASQQTMPQARQRDCPLLVGHHADVDIAKIDRAQGCAASRSEGEAHAGDSP